MTLAFLIVLVMVAEAMLHYMPWRMWFGRELPRPIAYIVGVTGFAGPLSWWLVEHGETETLVILWIAIVSGGLSVMLFRFIDWLIDLVKTSRERKEREEERSVILKETIDGKSG